MLFDLTVLVTTNSEIAGHVVAPEHTHVRQDPQELRTYF